MTIGASYYDALQNATPVAFCRVRNRRILPVWKNMELQVVQSNHLAVFAH